MSNDLKLPIDACATVTIERVENMIVSLGHKQAEVTKEADLARTYCSLVNDGRNTDYSGRTCTRIFWVPPGNNVLEGGTVTTVQNDNYYGLYDVCATSNGFFEIKKINCPTAEAPVATGSGFRPNGNYFSSITSNFFQNISRKKITKQYNMTFQKQADGSFTIVDQLLFSETL